MGLFEHFPYTNFHSLNIQWAIEKIKELITQTEQATANSTALQEELREWQQTTQENLDSWLTTAEGNIETGMESALKYTRTLTSADDFDSLTAPGIYRYTSSSVPANAPITDNSVSVCVGNPNNPTGLAMLSLSYNGKTFVRFRSSSRWLSWHKLFDQTDLDDTLTSATQPAQAAAVGLAISTVSSALDSLSASALVYRQLLTSNDDLDTLTNPGVYRYTASNMPSHAPIASNATIICAGSPATVSGLCMIAVSYNGPAYVRYHSSSAWLSWHELRLNVYNSAKDTYQGRKASRVASQIQAAWTARSTIPGYNNIVSGRQYNGIIYNNAQAYGRDLLYNIGLPAFISMTNLQQSYLYTYIPGVDSVEAYYGDNFYTGTVCSSLVSWITGQPVCYSTYDLVRVLNYRPFTDVSDLEIGDVIICHQNFTPASSDNHAAVITGIQISEAGTYSITITEAWRPTSRNVTFTAAEFAGLFTGETREGEYYRLARFKTTNMRSLPSFSENPPLIPLKGVSSSYRLTESLYVYSELSSIAATSPDGTTSIIPLSEITPAGDGTKNISTYLQTPGVWRLGDDTTPVLIARYNTGAATITRPNANTVHVALTGNSGCTVCGYYVIAVVNSSGYGKFPTHLTPADYSSTSAARPTAYSRDNPKYIVALDGQTEFDVDISTLAADISRTATHMYVRILLNTGVNQAYVDTPLVTL